eukprot:7256718-Prymnesium_polylepis.3
MSDLQGARPASELRVGIRGPPPVARCIHTVRRECGTGNRTKCSVSHVVFCVCDSEVRSTLEARGIAYASVRSTLASWVAGAAGNRVRDRVSCK